MKHTNSITFKTTNQLQDALTEAEGLLSLALFALHEAPENKEGRAIRGGAEVAIQKALDGICATGTALDSVNIHQIKEFSNSTPEKVV